MPKKIISELKKVAGLDNFIVLNKVDKETIKSLEQPNNHGILESVKRKNTIAFTHDSSFRAPAGEIVKEVNGKTIFPPVPFPEVKGRNVVSSSPGYEVDGFLRKKMKHVKKDDATLIVGWDE